MRKFIVLLLCLAIPAELYWLYQQNARPKVQEQTPVPKNNPVQRLLGSPEAAEAIENSKRRLPKGAGEIHGLLRDISGKPAVDVVIVATPIVGFGVIPPANQPQWTAKSDANGDFHFTKLPLENYILSAVEGEKHWIEAVALDKNSPLAELRPTLKASLSLRGRIVDARGKDIPWARVYPIPVLSEADTHLPQEEQQQINSYTFLPATADESGEFSLGHLPDRPWRLLLMADAFANTLSETISPPDKLALVMDTGVRMEVELKLPDGQNPAANMYIELIEQEFGLEKYNATTDAAGKFVFTDLRPATWRFVSRDALHVLPEALRQVSTTKDEPLKTLSANLEIGGAITGHVLKRIHLSAMPGIFVEARSLDGANSYQAKTDKEGFYRLSGMIPGDYTLTAHLDSEYVLEEASQQSFQVQAQQDTIGPDFFLVKGLAVKGLVLDSRDELVKNAVVRMEILGASSLYQETKCDKNGRFTFSGLYENTQVRLRASANGMTSEAYGPKNIGSGNQENIRLILAQPNRGAIGGSVVNAQGQAIPDVVVLCQPDESLKFETLTIRTDKFGDYQFSNLVPGAYTLTAGHSPEAMAPNSAQKITLEPNATLTDLQLLLP